MWGALSDGRTGLSLGNEVKTIAESTHGQIQTLTKVVQCNKSEGNNNMESSRNELLRNSHHEDSNSNCTR
jgi:hypothetical protein